MWAFTFVILASDFFSNDEYRYDEEYSKKTEKKVLSWENNYCSAGNYMGLKKELSDRGVDIENVVDEKVGIVLFSNSSQTKGSFEQIKQIAKSIMDIIDPEYWEQCNQLITDDCKFIVIQKEDTFYSVGNFEIEQKNKELVSISCRTIKFSL